MNREDKITDNICDDYFSGDSVYDESLKLKYVARILKYSQEQRHFKSYKFFKEYGDRWSKCDAEFADWLTLADKWLRYGYPDLADFCEKRCRRFLNVTRVPENHRHYHRRRGSISLGHSCNQGQLQSKRYRITPADWKVDYHMRADKK